MASLSAMGRLGSVAAGASVLVTGTASGSADEGASAGDVVPPRIGTSCSTVGADVVPHAAAVSAISKRLARTLFMVF